jgi:long-subunit acyl-CoA synthetase (AMP-forming)
MKIDKFLMPKQITVTPELFTVDNNLVTPKQSLRRKEILKRYNLLPTN